MKRLSFASTCIAVLAISTVSAAGAPEVHRSPVDVALSPDGAWLVTANQTSNSASLIDARRGILVDEATVGEHPVAVVFTPDGRFALVTGSYSGDLTILEVAGGRLKPAGAIALGYEPCGVAVSPDGKTAYVALFADDSVAVIDLQRKEATGRIAVGRQPRSLALSPDGARLVATLMGDLGVAVIDTEAGEVAFKNPFKAINLGQVAIDREGKHAYLPWMIYRDTSITASNIRLGWVLASRIARVRIDEKERRETLSLDPPGKAVSDPHGIAFTPDESWMVVSASGTHELLAFKTAGLPIRQYPDTDHIDRRLAADSDRFFRIDTGGRPLGIRAAADGRTFFVANYLSDSVQVVDLEGRKVAKEIFLGGPKEISLARRGEAIFYDGQRSLDQWYSCHSCHYEGGGNARAMDTFNDGTAATYKTVLPLQAIAETGPWTWHGWQDDLDAAMRKSLTETMLGPEPTDNDVEALLAYFSKLRLPPNPHRQPDGSLSPLAERGKEIFHGSKAACSQCHSGPRFTDGQVHDIGTGSSSDAYQGYNTPSLIGVHRRTLLMHDGRAATLEELLRGPHSPDRVAGEAPLDDAEISALAAYLKSL